MQGFQVLDHEKVHFLSDLRELQNGKTNLETEVLVLKRVLVVTGQ